MKTRIVRSILSLAIVLGTTAFAVAQIPPGDQGLGTRLGLMQQNNSGQVGDVTLFRRGADRTLVVLRIEGAPHHPEPAHVHRGTCERLDPVPAYPLNNVVNGRSSTIVNAPIGKLLSGNYSVNVHASAANLKHYVACGHLHT